MTSLQRSHTLLILMNVPVRAQRWALAHHYQTAGPQVDTTNSGAVGQAGGVLLTTTIAASGLGPAMSDALSVWRKPLAVHDPAKVVLDLAVTLGGDCLADVALLRGEPGLYGAVASDATVSRTITALAGDAPAALAAIDAARAVARNRAWKVAGRTPRTTVPARGRR
jgi:hypothetical protein